MGMVLPPSPPSIEFFKDTCGRWRTKSLFYEENDDNKYQAVFTLREEDREVDGTTYISVKRKYLEYADPTEYIFATKVFGSYECWENICDSPFLKVHIEQWRKELDLKLKAEAISHIRARMGSDINAERFFAEEKWKTPSKRGRPKKVKVDRPWAQEHKEASARLGIV
jgi:hypothetical protein